MIVSTMFFLLEAYKFFIIFFQNKIISVEKKNCNSDCSCRRSEFFFRTPLVATLKEDNHQNLPSFSICPLFQFALFFNLPSFSICPLFQFALFFNLQFALFFNLPSFAICPLFQFALFCNLPSFAICPLLQFALFFNLPSFSICETESPS